VDTAGVLDLPTMTLGGNLSLATVGNVTQSGPVSIGGNTHIDAGNYAIVLDNSSNNFVGTLGGVVGNVGLRGTEITIASRSTMNLGQIEATDGGVELTAGGSILDNMNGTVTNIISTAASTLSGMGGVVGTRARPIQINVPQMYSMATGQIDGVSIDMAGTGSADNTIHWLNYPPGCVILNGVCLNDAKPAYFASRVVLDKSYLLNNGNVLVTPPASTVESFSATMYPTEDNYMAMTYGPHVYEFSPIARMKNGGVALPEGVQQRNVSENEKAL